MAIAKLKSGKYRVTIDIQGIKPYSKTFSLKKNAQAWQKRQLDDIEAARAYGNQQARKLLLSDLIRDYLTSREVGQATVINLGWWQREYGSLRL